MAVDARLSHVAANPGVVEAAVRIATNEMTGFSLIDVLLSSRFQQYVGLPLDVPFESVGLSAVNPT
jgi:hypothetical protein